jgi:hypothetical protein
MANIARFLLAVLNIVPVEDEKHHWRFNGGARRNVSNSEQNARGYFGIIGSPDRLRSPQHDPAHDR